MRLTKFILTPILFTLLAPFCDSSLAASLPPLKGPKQTVLRAVPLPVPPSAAPEEAVSEIGKRFGVQIVAFSPTYPVDKQKLGMAQISGSLAGALDLLGDALDGRAQALSDNFYVVVPNLTVSIPAAPLMPQIRAAVRNSVPIAWILYDIPPKLRPVALAPSAIDLRSLGPDVISDIHQLLFDGKSISASLFDGQGGGQRTISIRPELMVSVCYGYTTLASYDEWAQRDVGDSVRWDLYNSLSMARAAFKAPVQSGQDRPIELGGAEIAITKNSITGADLSRAGDAAGAEFIIGQNASSLKAAVTPGYYAVDDFLQAMRMALRLRIYQARTDPQELPIFAVAGPGEKENRELTHDLVDRQIVSTWDSMIDALMMRGDSLPGPFSLSDFGNFATIPYDSLNGDQKEIVDKALALLKEPLHPGEKERLFITLRPALLASCRADQRPTADLEEISTLYGDSDPAADKNSPDAGVAGK